MSDEGDDIEYVVIASKSNPGLDRFFGLIHQDFEHQFKSFDQGVAAIVADFRGAEARQAAQELRTFLARTAALGQRDLIQAVFDMGAGYWPFDDDIRTRLDAVAAELERRAVRM